MTDSSESQNPTKQRFDREALAADARELVEAIESLHPEPYMGYDGRVSLQAALEHIVRNLPDEESLEAFFRRTAPLVAGLDDAHSYLHPPDWAAESDGPAQRLPLGLRVVGERLYVESVADDNLQSLLGGELRAVETTPVESLVDRVTSFRGAENRHTACFFTARKIEGWQALARLLDRSTPPAEPTIRVHTDSEAISVELSLIAEDTEPVHKLETAIPRPAGTGPRYRFFENGDVALFVPGDLHGYRETFEARLAAGADVDDMAEAAYDRHVDGARPVDLSDVVAALPSMSETAVGLCEEMAAVDTQTLIVDLRDNTGGDSQFVNHLVYALRGWDGIANLLESVQIVKRRTESYRERYGANDIGTAADNPASYDLTDFLDDGDEETGRLASQRERLLRSKTFADLVERVGDGGVYAPEQLVVAVSASTLSSGFAGAAQLSSIGATVVGVPSGQAPRSFGEPVEKTLSNTGLIASIAASMYHWIPDPSSDYLELDRELTPTLFKESGLVVDAGLWLAFSQAGVAEVGDELPTPGGA